MDSTDTGATKPVSGMPRFLVELVAWSAGQRDSTGEGQCRRDGVSIRGSWMNERGSMMPLLGGAIVLILAITLGITSATSLLIERMRLLALADSVALFASESFDPSQVRRSGSGTILPLTSAGVESSAREFLNTVGPGSLEAVSLVSATTPDGRYAEVTMSSLWRPPVVTEFFPVSLRISATGSAQTFAR